MGRQVRGAHTGADADLVTLVAPDGNGRFVLTISPSNGQIYQGIVGLHGGTISELLQEYLSNSQQTETRMWLREDGDMLEALLLERLPDSSGDDTTPAWNAVAAQAEAVFAVPFMPFPYEQWLQFAFAGHDVKLHPAQPAAFACACSIERVMNALKLVGEDELRPLIVETGKIETRCEFCGNGYEIDEAQFDVLFRATDPTRLPGPRTVQ